MGFRTVYGNSNSENSWPMIDIGSCEWVTVPGTGVNLQIQQGQPLQILRAFAADFNEFVELLRDNDTACWTLTNSVGSSNHLSGTALDLNWDSHPFQILNAGFDDAKIATIRELLDFYEDTIFWGNDWNTPKDAMHFQLGYDTFNNPKTASFIARKIRSDGYSTFRRGPIQAQTKADPKDQYAQAIIAEGQRRGITPRGITIALATALVESDLVMYANAKVPDSMAIPHEAVGSDGYSVGLFQQQVIQSNGQWWWGDAATCMDPTLSAGLFYERLAAMDYNGPNSPGWYAQAVQKSAYPDRYDEHYADAQALYSRLAISTPDPTPVPVPSTPGGFMSALSDAEQRALYDEVMSRRNSRSPLRHVGEGAVGDTSDMVYATDGSVHVLLVQTLARLGDPDSINLLNEVASLDTSRFPDRVHDKNLARAILNDLANARTVASAPATGITPGVVAAVPVPVPVAAPAAAPVAVSAAPVPAPSGSGVQSQLNSVGADIAALRDALSDLTHQTRS